MKLRPLEEVLLHPEHKAEIATLRARVAVLESCLAAADRLASYMLDVCRADTDLLHARAYRAARAALASPLQATGGSPDEGGAPVPDTTPGLLCECGHKHHFYGDHGEVYDACSAMDRDECFCADFVFQPPPREPEEEL